MARPPDETSRTQAGTEVRVRGLVQGVGFRPLVWRLARDCGLSGHVLNDGEGVLIRVWGLPDSLTCFLDRLRENTLPLARIDAIERTSLAVEPASNRFEIVDSRSGRIGTGVLPDAAICRDCLADINDPHNHRYLYTFTNCTHCGPRLSIIKAIPYDRAQTSMASFPMCGNCAREYADPADRRFHAQPNACPACGPRLWLERAGDAKSGTSTSEDPITAAAALIRQGGIVAVKGIGGFHLACDAASEKAVSDLRARKKRPGKPFALMVRDIAMARDYAQVSADEQRVLESTAAPIVLLDSPASGRSLASGIAPGQATLGIMLPYTPLHHLLMAQLDRPIVLSSGNHSDEPQCIANDDARRRLSGIVDAWLMHDREIMNRLDDSVVRIVGGQKQVLRRARGYAPAPLRLPEGFKGGRPVLALGGELKTTFCLAQNGEAILSQHIGDLEEARAHDDYRKTLTLYRKLFAFTPAVIATDLHPGYFSTQWGEALAREPGVTLEPVQHHHAHIAACMAEHRLALDHKGVLGIVLDGLGMGDDGALWGGEFLLADYCAFRRLAHFEPMPLPGGAQAMREPWRNTYAFLSRCLGWRKVASRYHDLPLIEELKAKPLALLERMIRSGFNSPPASSAGRLFDAVAGALGICRERISYEGQAAIELEVLAACASSEDEAYNFILEEKDPLVIRWAPLWNELLTDIQKGRDRAVIAARFHDSIAAAVASTAVRLRDKADVRTVVLSGGVFQNRLLLQAVTHWLERDGFVVLRPVMIPANDGGLALGQAAIATARQLAT